MKAEINYTNSGAMYLKLEVDENNLEELIDLTEFAKRTRSLSYRLRNFGGGAGFFGKNKNKHLDYYLNIMVDEEK